MSSRQPNFGRDISLVCLPCRVVRLLAVLAALGLLSTMTRAETLGQAQLLTGLGQPLRLAIGVERDAGPPLDPGCLAVVAPRQSDGLPHILTGRVAVQRQGSASEIVVTTLMPVAEPVVRLLLRTDCAGTNRLYTLFLEPPGTAALVAPLDEPRQQDRARGLAPRPSGSAIASALRATTLVPVPSTESAGRSLAHGAAPARGRSRAGSGAAAASATSIGANPAEPSAPPVVVSPSLAPATGTARPDSAPDPATLEAENQALKRELAQLEEALQRTQQTAATLPSAPAVGAVPAPVVVPARAAAITLPVLGLVLSKHWDVGISLAAALGGLAALTLGGFMWQRRRSHDWPLTGPPSHRLVSRTSLSEDPVPFKPSGVQLEGEPTRPSADRRLERWPRNTGPRTPASLLFQPSAEDLGRELEEELAAAARAHSTLERSHPELVDTLSRNWGTATARAQMSALLAPGSAELARMSGEAVSELRLLQRIAEDLVARNVQSHAAMAGSAPA